MCLSSALESPLRTEATRQRLLEGRALLRQRYHETRNGLVLLRDHARLIDQILREVWRDMSMPDSIALIAVGGYGRGQLFPYSDVDLLVLLPAMEERGSSLDDETRIRLEQWVRFLWDIGLEVGHSVRTLSECTEEAAKDITVQTSLLEARQLAGPRGLFQEFSGDDAGKRLKRVPFSLPSSLSSNSGMADTRTQHIIWSPI